jgi:hypothetical protein
VQDLHPVTVKKKKKRRTRGLTLDTEVERHNVVLDTFDD